MPTVTLTAKSALALPPGEGGARIDYWDQKVAGLVLRVTAKVRTYSVWYRINGAARRFAVGHPLVAIRRKVGRGRGGTGRWIYPR